MHTYTCFTLLLAIAEYDTLVLTSFTTPCCYMTVQVDNADTVSISMGWYVYSTDNTPSNTIC
jgi:hypothetical protein